MCIYFLGAVAKLRKPTISSHIRLSVRMEQFDSHWTDFDNIWYVGFFFRKYEKKIQVSLKSDKNNRYLTWRRTYIYDNVLLNSS